MKRTIDSITAVSVGADGGALLFALADDGTVWKLRTSSTESKARRPWVRLPDLPQDSGEDPQETED